MKNPKIGERVAAYSYLNEDAIPRRHVGVISRVNEHYDDVVVILVEPNGDSTCYHRRQCVRLKKKAPREWWFNPISGNRWSDLPNNPPPSNMIDNYVHVREVRKK